MYAVCTYASKWNKIRGSQISNDFFVLKYIGHLYVVAVVPAGCFQSQGHQVSGENHAEETNQTPWVVHGREDENKAGLVKVTRFVFIHVLQSVIQYVPLILVCTCSICASNSSNCSSSGLTSKVL